MKTLGKVIAGTALSLLIVSLFVTTAYYSGMIYQATQNPLFLPPGWKTPSGTTAPSGGGTTPPILVGCNPSTGQPVYVTPAHYDGDSTLSNLAWARYTNQGGTLVQVADSPGTETDVTKSSSSSINYPIGTTYEYIYQSSGPNSYPLWVQVGSDALSNPKTHFGQQVFTVQCQGSASNPNVSVWSMTAVLFESPTNGVTATTYVKAVVQYPGATPSAFPTSAATWNIQLQDYQNDKVGMLQVPLCGTQSSPVQNYATGQVSYGCSSGPGQGGNPIVQGYLLMIANVTGISVSLGSNAAPGTSLQTITGNQLSSGTRAWVVSLPEAAPAPGSGTSSSAPYYFANVPISIYETATQGTAKGEIVFWFIDNQQLAYLNQYLTDPATCTGACSTWATASAAGTSSYGAPTGISGLVPTSGQNAGNPAALIEQYVAVVLTY